MGLQHGAKPGSMPQHDVMVWHGGGACMASAEGMTATAVASRRRAATREVVFMGSAPGGSAALGDAHVDEADAGVVRAGGAAEAGGVHVDRAVVAPERG